MNEETMFEVKWHHTNDVFTHCSIHPIRVIRRGILPGCSAESITAIGDDGRKFNGSPKHYFHSVEEARETTRREIEESIASYEDEMEDIKKQIEGHKNALKDF